MTMSSYKRTLQTALDDTIGPSPVKSTFEAGSDRAADRIVGRVRFRDGKTEPVYASSGLGPDLTAPGIKLNNVWVSTRSVWQKALLVRMITVTELLAMWDYSDKNLYKQLAPPTLRTILELRLSSPPGKIPTAELRQIAGIWVDLTEINRKG